MEFVDANGDADGEGEDTRSVFSDISNESDPNSVPASFVSLSLDEVPYDRDVKVGSKIYVYDFSFSLPRRPNLIN